MVATMLDCEAVECARRSRGARAWVAALVLCLSSSCVSLSLDELDVLNRSLDIETVVIQDRFSLYSPFDHEQTAPWLELVGEELGLVSELLQLEDANPIAVLLEPVADWMPAAQADGGGATPRGLLGWAQGDTVVVRVTPVPTMRIASVGSGVVDTVSQYRDTLRHEIAHAFLRQLELSDERWFSEGVAEFVEALAIGPSGLELGPTPSLFSHLASLPRSERSMKRLLSWSDEDPDAEVQPPDRGLAFSLIHYALEPHPVEDWVSELRLLSDASRTDLLARESGWHAWLEAQR